MKKRILSLLLSLIMVLSLLPTTAWAGPGDSHNKDDHFGPGDGSGSSGTSNTVDHIDVAMSFTIPGTTDSLILDWTEVGNITITDADGENYTYSVDAKTSTDSSGNPQYRLNGSFPVGTKTAPVYYTLTLEVKRNGASYTLTVTTNYWHTDNKCPGLSHSQTTWQNGSVISGSGIDVAFGSASATEKQVHVTKIVEGVDTADLAADKQFTVTFSQNGAVKKTVDLKMDQGVNSKTLITTLPAGTYYVAETAYDSYDGYTHASTTFSPQTLTVGANGGSVTVTNAYTKDATASFGSLTITKTNVGATPASVTLTVTGPDSYSSTFALTAADNWTKTLTDLPAGTYTVTENTESAKVDGYTLSTTGTGNVTVTAGSTANVTVTNTYTKEKTSVVVEKQWVDSENAYNTRPASVTVKLLADSVDTGETLTLNATNGWKDTFNNLDKYSYKDDGSVDKGITYTVKEDNVDSKYTASVNGSIVTNTLKTGSLKISKEFKGLETNEYANLSIQFTVTGPNNYRNTVTLNAANRWTYTLTEIPLGQYTVTENKVTAAVDHYSLNSVKYSYYDSSDDSYTVLKGETPTFQLTDSNANRNITATNTYLPETTEIAVTKEWKGDEDYTNLRPSSISVQLYADDKAVTGGAATLTADESWSYTFTNLRKYDTTGKEIVYTVSETAVPTGYKKDVNGFTITNTAKWDEEIVNKASVTVTKYNDNRSEKLPGAEFTLYSAADEVVATATTGADGTCKFENLTTGTYTLKETKAPTGYEKVDQTVTITVNEASNTEINTSNKFQTTTTYTATPATADFVNNKILVSVDVTKEWKEVEGLTLPTSVEVELYKNSVATGKKLTLTAANDWKGTFEKLPEYDNETKNVYTVKEVNVPTGYESTDGNANNGYTITNTAQWGDEIVNPASLTLKKVDEEGNALAGAVFTLYDQDKVYATAESDEDGIVTFNNLLAGHGYELSETSAPDGYKRIFGAWQVYVAKNPDPTEIGKLVDGKFYNVYDCTVTVKDLNANEDGNYTITNELAPTEYSYELSIQKTVKKTGGNVTPGAETFTFSAYYLDADGISHSVGTATIETTGEGDYAGTLKLTVPASAFDLNANGDGTVTLSVSEVKGSAAGWTYDKTVYTLIMTVKNYEVAGITSGDTVEIIPNGDSVPDSQLPEIAPTVETLTFTNEFSQTKTPNRPNKPSKPITSVKTGDAGVAMYAMSGLLSLGGAALFMKKRKDEE